MIRWEAWLSKSRAPSKREAQDDMENMCQYGASYLLSLQKLYVEQSHTVDNHSYLSFDRANLVESQSKHGRYDCK